ncbi:hypothetical protein MPH_13475 [Macrophomina phaseolina MS6]|uniref:Secreted protein n=1 Tax=Macrophomina phaseolina (strain MS6) TaxID=1126212 RepID=K2RYH0_MACPH|nr:hypothetical protein MPH_13475 [Macrophomina phaseolina MS6]
MAAVVGLFSFLLTQISGHNYRLTGPHVTIAGDNPHFNEVRAARVQRHVNGKCTQASSEGYCRFTMYVVPVGGSRRRSTL